jgi:U3 small nucleolar RNA-associated protein 22
LQIHQASKSLEVTHGLVVPFPDPKPPRDSHYKVSFAAPAQFNVVGSYVSKTMVKSQSSHAIDMIVEMPNGIFQEKDYLDLRYFYKRAYYLTVLTASVRSELGSSVVLAYEHANGNRLLPVLSLTPKDASSKYSIRIIPCAPQGWCPTRKLLPTACCIRSATEVGESPRTPTPYYNSTLKAEGCYSSYLKILRQAEKACPAFKDACILGRVWLLQRGLGGSLSRGGFGHFEWAVLTALLLKSGGRKGVAPLSASFSSTQIFKAVVQYLAAVDLCRKPPVLGSSSDGLDALNESGPVILDAARQLNLAYKMSACSAFSLQQYARWTQASLVDRDADQFNPTFIIKADLPLHNYDALVQIEQPTGTDSYNIGEYGSAAAQFGEQAARVLRRALGDRVHLILVNSASDPDEITWELTSSPPLDLSTLLVGVLFNAANMARQVDQGPSVEEKQAAKEFRKFWGQKAELRRFKDGSILESLIWTQASPLGLWEEITRYALKLHLKIRDDGLEFIGAGFPAIIPIKVSDTPTFQTAREAFAEFEADLRELSHLPLQIRQVSAAAPELRSASVRPPPSLSNSKASRLPMDTVVYFEASGKWPDNLAAIQRTKIAFLLKIGELLTESKPGVVCRVGLEEAETEIENLAFLDVMYEGGASFRLRIHSDLEENLLERRIADKTLDQRVRTQGAQLQASFRRLYTHLPRHTQTMSVLCTRFPALSPTIRLLKHWFNSHKLSCHFLEELVEMFALRVFLEPYPWQAPSSAMTGFLRTLQFLSRWDWRTEPLVLDSTGELTGSERSAVATRLEAWRKIDPGMSHTTLIVATSNETSGTAYTIHDGRPTPSRVVATRMTTLARAACKLVKDKGIELDPRTLFQPSLKDYDVLIRLNGKAVKKAADPDDAVKQSQFKNLDGRTGRTPQPALSHPARTLLTRLNSLFSGPLLFFHGAPEDTVVAAIWNPQVQSRAFRVNLPCSYKPATSEDEEIRGEHVDVNREAILAEVARIGGELIEAIERA